MDPYAEMRSMADADAADAPDAAEIHAPSAAVGEVGVEDSQPASADPVVAVPDSPGGGEHPVVDSQIPESFEDSLPMDMPATPASDHGGDAVLKLLRAVKMKLHLA